MSTVDDYIRGLHYRSKSEVYSRGLSQRSIEEV